jgi:hypothetical protein
MTHADGPTAFALLAELVEADQRVEVQSQSKLKAAWDTPETIRISCEVACGSKVKGGRVTILELTSKTAASLSAPSPTARQEGAFGVPMTAKQAAAALNTRISTGSFGS